MRQMIRGHACPARPFHLEAMITSEQFRRLFPACPAIKARTYLPLLVAAMVEFQITTRARAAAFCAQVGHESLDFKFMEEIASGDAYDTRTDLGNTPQRDGDGRKFKGRGPIQTTGRTNYEKAAKALGLPLLDRPALLSDPQHGFRASAFFWLSNKLNRTADGLNCRGDYKDLGQFDKITKRINGGYNHRVERQRRYLVALSVLTAGQFSRAQIERQTAGEASVEITPEATAPATPAQGPQPPAVVQATAEPSLLDDVPVNDTTKGVARSGLTLLRARTARPLAILSTALAAGNVWAWAALIVLVGGAAWLVYRNRSKLKAEALALLRKFKTQ